MKVVFQTSQPFRQRQKLILLKTGRRRGLTFNLRMEKDKVIWLSAALGMARIMITPEKVQYYSKLDNQYFDGDYALLSDFAGTLIKFL